MLYSGNEHFTANGNNTAYTMYDFWRWAYSDTLNNLNRAALAEFIVATALKANINQPRDAWRPYDLLTEDRLRIEVKAAAYVQAWEPQGIPQITFSIAPAKIPNAHGSYDADAVARRNSDVYVFCVFTAMQRDISPLRLDFWEFYSIATATLDEKKPGNRTLTLHSLQSLEPFWSDYGGINEAVHHAMGA